MEIYSGYEWDINPIPVHVSYTPILWSRSYLSIPYFPYLVGGFKHFLFSIIYGIILPNG